MQPLPTTIPFPEPLRGRRKGKDWYVEVGGTEVKVSNATKIFWEPEGYTKADLVTYYANVAPTLLPYVTDRPLTLKRMPDGADGGFFYEKQAPAHRPGWVRTAPVVSADSGKRVDYVVAGDAATLVWLANLGCIELHPWHSRVDDLGHPDYAFFDLDPFGSAGFDLVREIAQLIRTVLDRLDLRGYPRTSGATGMQVYVPIERVHSYAEVRAFVERVCRLVNRADPERTTMDWDVSARGDRVFLDHNMNTEGKNIAATWCLRPERHAPVATPLRWDELDTDVRPQDFTITTIWERLAATGDLFAPVLAGGQDLRAAMTTLGIAPGPEAPKHRVAEQTEAATAEEAGDLTRYRAMRDFSKTSEPADDARAGAGEGSRFVIQQHLATRLHHDLRLERGGAARSWAIPKGLPLVRGLRHLAVQTEDHPLSYLEFEGEIPEGEYGGGQVRIWDRGAYEAQEWRPDKVTFRLHGQRHQGTWHLFQTRDQQWLVTRKDEPTALPAPPPRFAPMLATAADAPFDDPAWLFEVKWDGIRVITTAVRPGTGEEARTLFVTRQGNDVSAAYPELASVWERVLAFNAVLDAEIVALGPDGVPSFERLQERMHVRDEHVIRQLRRRIPVTLMVFDLLAVDGEALIDQPLSERLARLDELLIPGGPVARSEAVPEAGTALYEAVVARGMEGVIAKRAASVYRPGRRSQDWRKVKARRRIDCVIGGWLYGEGSLAGRLGSLLVGRWDGEALRFVGRVGSGFDEAERARVQQRLEALARKDPPFADTTDIPRGARWVEPELVCTVEYSDITEGGRLRAPVYHGLHPPSEGVSTS